jgi:putative membrane protein
VAVRFLDAVARASLHRAVQDLEAGSAAEVVIALRRRSASYLHANVAVGALAALASLAAMLFADHAFALSSILFDPFLAGLIAGAAVELTPGCKRALTPAATRRHAVLRAARATFVERGVHHTRDRGGVLVYLAWLERDAVIVADTGVTQRMPADALARAERALAAAMSSGGAAVAHALALLAPGLAAALPRRADDVNELPDVIDSDLERIAPPPTGSSAA